MKRKTKLEAVDNPSPQASVLDAEVAPAFIGDDDEDLICGGCGTILGRNISAATIRQRFIAPAQLILVCPKCQANNVLPAQVGH
jgi:hypothetical protein